MKVEGALERFALAVAIGSLFILGAFLIIDAQFDGFLGEFEKYSGSSSWTAVAAVPAVTFAYILGAFVQLLADLVVRQVSPKAQEEEWLALERLARSQNEILASQFEDLRRSKKLLEGCLGPLLLLSIGICAERSRLPHLSTLLAICSIATAAVALCIPFITFKLHKAMIRTAGIAASIGGGAQPTVQADGPAFGGPAA